MTEMHRRYLGLRRDGLSYREAVAELARQIGVDRKTVERALQHAGVRE